MNDGRPRYRRLLASLFNYPRLRSNHFMCTPFHTRQLLNLRSGSLQFTSEPQKSNNPISIDDSVHPPWPPFISTVGADGSPLPQHPPSANGVSDPPTHTHNHKSDQPPHSAA